MFTFEHVILRYEKLFYLKTYCRNHRLCKSLLSEHSASRKHLEIGLLEKYFEDLPSHQNQLSGFYRLAFSTLMSKYPEIAHVRTVTALTFSHAYKPLQRKA